MSDNEISLESLSKLSGANQPAVGMRREVLAGEEVYMPEPGAAHGRIVDRLNALLGRAVGDDVSVSVASVLDPDGQSEVRPDLAVLAATSDEPLLVIEVADTPASLSHARGRKASFYARSGVGECWVVDMVSQQVLVHRSPASGGYREILNLRAGSTAVAEQLPAARVEVGELLGN